LLLLRELDTNQPLVSHGREIEVVIDDDAKLRAIDRVLRVRESLQRLKGLDAAQRTEAKVTIETTTVLDAEIAALVDAMRAGDGGPGL
jgi:hypothetical protein